jgi:plastocyanin
MEAEAGRRDLMRTRVSLEALVLVLALPVGVASAKDVQGVVFMKKAPDPAAVLKVTRDEKVCGATLPDDSLLVGADGGVANAVVVVKLASPPPPKPSTVVIDQVGCRFLPRVSAVPVGSTVEMVNSDAVMHNARAMQGATTAFNFAFPMKNLKRKTQVKSPGVLDFRCDAGHTWMRALVHVVPHTFFAVTDEQGRFTVTGVPDDAKELEVRHEKLEAPRVVAIGAEPLRVELP